MVVFHQGASKYYECNDTGLKIPLAITEVIHVVSII